MFEENKFAQADIARALKRDPSVISREIRRNSDVSGYDSAIAQRSYYYRKLKTVYRKTFNEKIFPHFKEQLKARISPDVIAGKLKTAEDKSCLCHPNYLIGFRLSG
jgi:IS30 family transposase